MEDLILKKGFTQSQTGKNPKACVDIENYISRIQEKFERWKPSQKVSDNLSREERQFLKSVNENDDIIYMWEDKGPSFVKLSREQYLRAGNVELDNDKFYQEMLAYSPVEVKRKNDILVDEMLLKNEIPLKVAEYLKGGQCEVAKFYHLLKTHKIPATIDDPSEWLTENGFPIRGIVSGIGTPTERLSGFVDYFLQPGMQSLETFLKDGKHTVKIIEEINDQIKSGDISLEGVALVSLDVEAMYNNMTEDLGTGACEEFLENRIFQGDGDQNSISSESILSALELCLQSNIFQFNEKLFKQVGGVGTGMKLSPTYACLGMGNFEKVVQNSNQDHLRKIILWKHFIDDILMLFRGTKSECESMVTWLNSLMPGVVKLKFEFSHTRIVFLDLEIFMEDGILKTDLHIKPTNKQLYLDYNSNHPNHCKEGIPYSQALRVIEKCSEISDRDGQLATLKTKFEHRNYPSELIDCQFEKAQKKDRKALLTQPPKAKNCKDNKVRLIFTHNRANPPIHQWVRESKHLLRRNDRAKDIGSRIQVASRQPKNLQQLVGGFRKGSGGSQIPPDAGCQKCKKKCKVACPVIEEGKYFTSFNTGKRYNIKQKLDCDSAWVIYLCTCKKCGGQYVGKSKTPFKLRHSNHKQEIKNKIGGLGHHYGGSGGCGYQNFSVILIEEVKTKTLEFLANREVFWQHQLRVYVENGCNGHCYRKEI